MTDRDERSGKAGRDMSDWEPPRCIHGRIILGCPDENCPTQNAYLDQQNAALDDWHRRGQQAARDIVRQLLNLPNPQEPDR